MTVIVIAATMMTAAAVATEVATARVRRKSVLAEEGVVRCAGMYRCQRVAGKSLKPFDDFIRQRGAMFFTLS